MTSVTASTGVGNEGQAMTIQEGVGRENLIGYYEHISVDLEEQ